MRVHKSYIVSIRHIESIDRNVLKIAGDMLYIGGKLQGRFAEKAELSVGYAFGFTSCLFIITK